MQHRNRFFTVLKIAGLVGALCPTLALGAPQSPPSAPVTVVNTPANPVPVTGTVTGTVTGNVGVTGTVDVDGTVTVINPATAPVLVRNVDQPARVPYQTQVRGELPLLPTVPAGKRLVIQNISARAFVNGTALGMLKLTIGGEIQFVFPMTFAGSESGAGDLWVGNFPTLIFIDGGQVGQFTFEAPFLTPSIQAVASGYLLDCSASCPPIAP